MENNFVFASQFLQHSVCMAICVLLYVDGTRLIRLGASIAYVVHVSAAHGLIKWQSVHIRLYLVILFSIGIAETLETRHMQLSDVAVMQTLNAVFRLCMVALHVEPRIHTVGQISMSVTDVLVKLMIHGPSANMMAYAFVECFVACGSVLLSISLAYYMRETLAAQFRSDDAEKMLAGFRRMLCGICDGEILLDGQLRIQGPGACLNQILSTNADFQNKPFMELLVDSEEEKARFRDFISTSSKACINPDMYHGMPPCLRASLQGKASTRVGRVGVDLFHVSLSNLFGSGEDYHLLAMKQDTEIQVLPDARAEDIPQQLLKRLVRHRSQAPSSDSGTSGCTWLQTPQLAEMMLLVDATKRHQDVCQALHSAEFPLSFRWGPESEAVPNKVEPALLHTTATLDPN